MSLADPEFCKDRGQGLNNAITDAAEFLFHLQNMKAYSSEELAAAVKRYEAELWPRGNTAVFMSYENTSALHNWSAIQESPLFKYGVAKDQATNKA